MIDFSSAELKRTGCRVIFIIKGNNYRLIVKINFHYQMIWIRFIGTHKEYDRIEVNKI